MGERARASGKVIGKSQMPPCVINPSGYFDGDRQKRLSREAHFKWPSFFLASDGNGRFEVNILRIIGRAFANVTPPVTEGEITACIQEYVDAGLLFLYEHEGRVWGVWDTNPKWLPTFKTAEDKRNPAPPKAAFDAWIRTYKQSKAQTRTAPVRGILEKFQKDFQNVSETFPRGVGVGVGVGSGVGVGVGKGVGVGVAAQRRGKKQNGKGKHGRSNGKPTASHGLTDGQPMAGHGKTETDFFS